MAEHDSEERVHHSDSSDSEGDILNLQNDEGWEDAEPDELGDIVVSLFDQETFPDIHAMIRHCKDKHGFDFLEIRQNLNLDFYGSIKLVNYIRACVRDGKSVSADLKWEDISDDSFLKPILADDAVIFNLDELADIVPSHEQGTIQSSNASLIARVSELEDELKQLQTHFDNYRETVAKNLDERWNAPSTSSNTTPSQRVFPRDDDSHYFKSYSYNDIHETMLKDTVRTNAYRDFIYDNKYLFAGKTVLDIGCGTGILSMFCARAGASLVIAVDNSAIIDKARSIVFANSLSPPIVLLRGKIEEVKLPVEKVDIIISEWMGYALLYEAMLDSVIWARDRYLKDDGLMVPSHMNMWLAPVEDQSYVEEHISWWRDVYGFDMHAMQEGIHDDALVLMMPQQTLCADPTMFLQLDLYQTSVRDLSFSRDWSMALNRDIDSLDGFVTWFDTFFMPAREDTVPLDAKAETWTGKGVAFTTGPNGKETHWKQGVTFISNVKSHAINHKAGQSLCGKIDYSVPEDNSRALNIALTWQFEKDNVKQKPTTQIWALK